MNANMRTMPLVLKPMLLATFFILIPLAAMLFINLKANQSASDVSMMIRQVLSFVAALWLGYLLSNRISTTRLKIKKLNVTKRVLSIGFLLLGITGLIGAYVQYGIPLFTSYETRLAVVLSPFWSISLLGVAGAFFASQVKKNKVIMLLYVTYLTLSILGAWKNYVLMVAWFYGYPYLLSAQWGLYRNVLVILSGVVLLIGMNVIRPNANGWTEIPTLLVNYLGMGLYNGSALLKENNHFLVEGPFFGLSRYFADNLNYEPLPIASSAYNSPSMAFELYNAYGYFGNSIFGFACGVLISFTTKNASDKNVGAALFTLTWIMYSLILYHNASIFRSTGYVFLLVATVTVLFITRDRYYPQTLNTPKTNAPINNATRNG